MKTMLVTGAGSGLGYELAKAHAEQGYEVFALDVAVSDKLKSLAAQYPDAITILECDIGSTESVEKAMDTVKAKIKKLDRLFNNAGIHRFDDWVTLDETDVDFFNTYLNINAVGPMRVAKAALPLLQDGSILIHTSSEAGSVAGTEGIIGYGYSMSKSAFNMGAKILDNWLKDKGIRTLLIHPGRMRTAMQGAHSNIDPDETALGLMALAENIDSIPKTDLFMDYKGVLYPW